MDSISKKLQIFFLLHNVGSECKYYKHGDDYVGSLSKDMNGQQCSNWSDLAKSSLSDTSFFNRKLKQLDSWSNFCRYHEESMGVFCPVDGALSPCSIPYCSTY